MKNPLDILLNARRIILFRTDRIGDVILTLPMVNVLKSINPNASLSILVSKYTESLVKNQPLINEFYVIESIPSLFKFLRAKKYDVAFFPRIKLNEVTAAFFANIPLRVGSGFRWFSIMLNFPVYEHRKYGTESEARHNINLISAITKESYEIELIPPVIDPILRDNILKKYNIPLNFVIIHPGGGGSAPKLPVSKYAMIANILNYTYKIPIVITGNSEERSLAAEILKLAPQALDLTGKLTLDEFIAVISASEGIITNSTGAIHIAASFNKKIIGFYPNSPAINSVRWGPISKNKTVILTPPADDFLLKDDLSQIKINEIESALSIFTSP